VSSNVANEDCLRQTKRNKDW